MQSERAPTATPEEQGEGGRGRSPGRRPPEGPPPLPGQPPRILGVESRGKGLYILLTRRFSGGTGGPPRNRPYPPCLGRVVAFGQRSGVARLHGPDGLSALHTGEMWRQHGTWDVAGRLRHTVTAAVYMGADVALILRGIGVFRFFSRQGAGGRQVGSTRIQREDLLCLSTRWKERSSAA